MTCGSQHTKYAETATADAEEPTNYYVTMLLAKAGAEKLRADTEGCTVDAAKFYKLYQNNEYAFTFCVQTQILTDEVYLYETADVDEAVNMAEKLRESLY